MITLNRIYLYMFSKILSPLYIISISTQTKTLFTTNHQILFPFFRLLFLFLFSLLKKSMDVTDIFLLFVVSLSVAVFIILQTLEKSQKSCLEPQHNKTNKPLLEQQPRTDFFIKEVVGAEKDLIFDDFSKDGCEERNETGHTCGVLGVSGNMGIMEDDYENFDDWEGVERTELEGLFGKAVVFVNNAADQIDGDLILQLYGLQKVALEGPCHESQPMALKVSARSKWNAWQRLGNMSREMAMEKYVEILSMAVPDWRKVEGEGVDASSKETSETQTSTYKDGVANEMLTETMQRDIDPSNMK